MLLVPALCQGNAFDLRGVVTVLFNTVVPSLWSAEHDEVVHGCVHLLNKTIKDLWHCDVTNKLVVRNFYVVGKVVIGCEKVGNYCLNT
jgi:hypothetical protein